MKKLTNLNWPQLAIMGTALALRMASAGTVSFSYLVLGAYALTGHSQAIRALALSWLFGMLSEGIAPVAGAAALGRYIVIACALVSVLLRAGSGRRGSSVNSPVIATLLLGAFFVLHAMFISPILDVSILKAISWMVVMVTLLLAWSGLSHEDRVDLEHQLFGGLIALVVVSVPLAFTGLGYLRNGTGFQGVFSQPQSFGPTVAMLGVWLIGRMLVTARPSWRDIGLLGLCLTLVVMSEARTAGMAILFGVVIPVVFMPLITRVRARRLMPGLASRKLYMLAFFAALILVFVGSNLSSLLMGYINKRGNTGSAYKKFEESRGMLIESMLANIEKSPMTGVGFGIGSDPESMEIARDPVFGLPVAASNEKGVLPIAVMEEVGIIGFVLVAAWLGFMVRRVAHAGIVPFSVLAALLFTNLAEATFFSPGGLGLLMLILFAWAVTEGNHSIRDQTHA